MNLELGLKITHTIDDVASSADFRIVKDKSGPLFLSKETESAFILTIHLKGYRREHIEIDINEAGTKIGICGKRPVQEKVMGGWMMYKKEVEIRGFRKVFRIPDGVVLDRIKAKFDGQESILTIVMPKSVKGVVGVGIEEVKEDGEDKRRPQMTQTAAEEVPENDEGSKKEIVADVILEKDMSGSQMQEVKDSKIQSIQDATKSASQHSEEPKIEEGDGIEIEKVGRKELDTESELQKTNAVEFMRLNDQSSEAEREMPKSGLEDVRSSRPESSESSKTDQVQGKQFTDEICKECDVVELQKQEPIKEDSANYQHEKEEGSHGIANEIQHMEEKKEIEKSSVLCSPFIIAGRCTIAEKEVELQKQETIEEGPAISQRIENEIQEATINIEGEHIKENKRVGIEAEVAEHIKENKEVEKCESPEMEKQKDVGEKSTPEKQPAGLQKSKLLCSPFIIASSVFIVSLAVIAIKRIRTRKR